MYSEGHARRPKTVEEGERRQKDEIEGSRFFRAQYGKRLAFRLDIREVNAFVVAIIARSKQSARSRYTYSPTFGFPPKRGDNKQNGGAARMHFSDAREKSRRRPVGKTYDTRPRCFRVARKDGRKIAVETGVRARLSSSPCAFPSRETRNYFT